MRTVFWPFSQFKCGKNFLPSLVMVKFHLLNCFSKSSWVKSHLPSLVMVKNFYHTKIVKMAKNEWNFIYQGVNSFTKEWNKTRKQCNNFTFSWTNQYGPLWSLLCLCDSRSLSYKTLFHLSFPLPIWLFWWQSYHLLFLSSSQYTLVFQPTMFKISRAFRLLQKPVFKSSLVYLNFWNGGVWEIVGE